MNVFKSLIVPSLLPQRPECSGGVDQKPSAGFLQCVRGGSGTDGGGRCANRVCCSIHCVYPFACYLCRSFIDLSMKSYSVKTNRTQSNLVVYLIRWWRQTNMSSVASVNEMVCLLLLAGP